MNKCISVIVMASLLFNAAPLRSDDSLTQCAESAKIVLKNAYNSIADTITPSKGYRIAVAVAGAFSALVLGSYVMHECSEPSKSRFHYLSNQEFIILAQHLVLVIDKDLEHLEPLIEQFKTTSSDSTEYEELRNTIYELHRSSKIINSECLCNELLKGVKTRENNIEQNNNSELESLTLLKATLHKQRKLLASARKISKPLIYPSNSYTYQQLSHYNSWHHNWHQYDWFYNTNNFQNTISPDITMVTTPSATSESKQTPPNPALIDLIPNITPSDLLLSSFS